MSEPLKSLQSSVVPEPTAEQRAKIRHLLDQYFDDDLGRYLDGMSDRAIGEAVKIGAAAVKKIRETGWGVERDDPELDRFRDDLAAWKQAGAELQARFDKLAKKYGMA